MDNYFCLRYTAGGETRTLTFHHAAQDENVSLTVCRQPDRTTVSLSPKRPIVIERAYCCREVAYTPATRVFLNGYQSWSACREARMDSFDRGIRRIPRVMDEYYAFSAYGDYGFYPYPASKGILHSWNYTYIIRPDGTVFLLGSLNETACFTVFTHAARKNRLIADADAAGLTVTAPMTLFSLYETEGEKSAALRRYLEACGYVHRTARRLRGYTSWYNYYQNINETVLLQALNSLRSVPGEYDVFQIDDGYETAVGDWLSVDREKFPHGLKPLADAARNQELTAGLWVAPFVCERKSRLRKKHPEWLARDRRGRPIKAGHNWSHSYVLDWRLPEVQDYLRRVFRHYQTMGFRFFKLDFLYAAALVPSDTKPRGALMREAMELLRSLLPEETLLGCGVPLFSAGGLVDYCRIGCDVGPDYDGALFMRGLHRERVSTKNALMNTIYRYHLDGYLFGNDPDVYLLRDGLKLTRRQQEALVTVNGLCSSLLFTSDDPSACSEGDRAMLEDILDQYWTEFRWYTEGRTIRLVFSAGSLSAAYRLDTETGELTPPRLTDTL